ncbi:Adiponectin receptor protein [Schistosoma japonicum]|nr:Adiponectin receptor protein [Schistosoma japonicum]
MKDHLLCCTTFFSFVELQSADSGGLCDCILSIMESSFRTSDCLSHNVCHVSSENDNIQNMRGKHRRMHSEGSACFTSSCDPLSPDKVNTDWISESGVRRRKFPEFCLFDDSSSQPTTVTNLPQQSWDFNSSVTDLKSLAVPKANHSPLTSHRRSASYGGDYFTFAAHEIGEAASRAVEHAEELVIHLWKKGWRVVHHHSLPHWLKDNDFILCGHRPQLPSFRECFRSIFRLHTETGNIWTHLIGSICFLILSISFLVRPGLDIHWQEKMVVQVFFISAILALGFSWLFHTVYCHSERVGRLFNKLDYVGISLLVIGSFVPWIHYSFYCYNSFKLVYITAVLILGAFCTFVCTQDYFLSPTYRAARALLFIALGLSGVVPCVHYILIEGFWEGVSYSALGWLVLMAVLYISGATIYALRIPERLYPGKFDIWVSYFDSLIKLPLELN